MFDQGQPSTLGIADILVGARPDHQLALVRLADVGVNGVRHHNAGENRLDRLRHQRLQRIAFQRHLHTRRLHDHRSVPRRRDRDHFRADKALGGFHPFDRPISPAPDRNHRAVLDDIDAALGRSPRVAPGHRVVPRGACAHLQRRPHYRITGIGRHVQRWAKRLGLGGGKPAVVDAVQPVGMDVTLERLHVMHVVRQHHHAALGEHDVVVQLGRQVVPQIQRVIVKLGAFVIKIVAADDRGVAARVAAAQPALFDHRDVRYPVFLRQIIGRPEAVPAGTHDDRVIGRLRTRVGPLLWPRLMAAQGFGEE